MKDRLARAGVRRCTGHGSKLLNAADVGYKSTWQVSMLSNGRLRSTPLFLSLLISPTHHPSPSPFSLPRSTLCLETLITEYTEEDEVEDQIAEKRRDVVGEEAAPSYEEDRQPVGDHLRSERPRRRPASGFPAAGARGRSRWMGSTPAIGGLPEGRSAALCRFPRDPKFPAILLPLQAPPHPRPGHLHV